MTGLIAAASTALILSSTRAPAQEVKVGVQLPYTGVGAENAQQIDRGLQLYLKLNPDNRPTTHGELFARWCRCLLWGQEATSRA
ncbi:ABC-type branched-subunit amino acid transport system substrate-binding protein [Bradyrhizobium sp. AZCC 1588]|uniref:hypothetical protein n=1 Tax=unclassified Bradyrhizobium TaxID=2631580 RepID=UPI002FF3B493